MNLPDPHTLEWWHVLVGTLITFASGAAAAGPLIAKSVRRTLEALLGKQLTMHVETLKKNEHDRELADASRMGGMIALTNLVNDGMARVEGLAARCEAAESGAATVIRNFNGLGKRIDGVEKKIDNHEFRIAKLEGSTDDVNGGP